MAEQRPTRRLSEQLRELIEQIKVSDQRSQELLNKYVASTEQRLKQLSLLIDSDNG